MLAVLVRWLAGGGMRQLAPDRHGDRDSQAALASLKQALLLTVTDVARVVSLALLAGLLVVALLTAVRLIGRRRWSYRRYAIAPYRTDDASPEQVLALFQDWHQQIHQRCTAGCSSASPTSRSKSTRSRPTAEPRQR
jgi:hypothetical protein